jgi:TusA-related sulfurtransferase
MTKEYKKINDNEIEEITTNSKVISIEDIKNDLEMLKNKLLGSEKKIGELEEILKNFK